MQLAGSGTERILLGVEQSLGSGTGVKLEAEEQFFASLTGIKLVRLEAVTEQSHRPETAAVIVQFNCRETRPRAGTLAPGPLLRLQLSCSITAKILLPARVLRGRRAPRELQ